MNQEQEPHAHWGLVIGFRIILAIMVLVLATGAVLWALDLMSLQALQQLAVKTALVGGIALAANGLLALLGGRRG